MTEGCCDPWQALLVENAATENYTETFEGVDYAGNPVVLRVLLRPLEHM